MTDDPTFTYDEAKRRGWCSCGRWTTYGVSRAEFDRNAQRHMAWHVNQARLYGESVPKAPSTLGVFEQTLAAINALPTTESKEH